MLVDADVLLQPGAARATAPVPPRRLRAARNLVNDAHLAALVLKNKATFVFDDDFVRFPGGRWEHPVN